MAWVGASALPFFFWASPALLACWGSWGFAPCVRVLQLRWCLLGLQVRSPCCPSLTLGWVCFWPEVSQAFVGCVAGLCCPSWFVPALGSWTRALAVGWSWYLLFSGPFLGFFPLASRLAAGLRWLEFLLHCPSSVASLWRVLTWFVVRCLLACPQGAAVPLGSGVRWCSYSSCWVTSLRSSRCSSSVHDRGMAFPSLVGLAFGISAVLLPQATLWALACAGLHCWPPFLWVGVAPSPWIPLLWPAWRGSLPPFSFSSCLPSGCGHPLGSLVSSFTIDHQRRFPWVEFFLWCGSLLFSSEVIVSLRPLSMCYGS